MVVNDGGAAFDFRFEGDTDQHLFFADGSVDNIGIGNRSPKQQIRCYRHW